MVVLLNLYFIIFVYLFNRDNAVKHSYNTNPATDALHIKFIANSLVGFF